MASNFKLLTELSDDELFKLLENTETVLSSKDKPDNVSVLFSFITFFNLKPGKEKILGAFLYTLFKDWSNIKLTKKQFIKELALYIRKDNQGYFRINASHLNLLTKSFEILKNKTKRKPLNKRVNKEHFEYYLNKYQLKPGNYFISEHVLYHLYDIWCYKRKVKSLSKNTINKFLKIFFKNPKITDDHTLWFGVDKESLNVDKEELKRLIVVYGKKS